MRGNKLHVDRTKKDVQHAARLAKGGTTKMFGKQAAGPDAPERTGKVETPAPGARSARGGKHKSKPQAAQSAKAGATGAR